MRYSKGRWVASYRDTYSLDYTLSPIIYAGLSKFHDVLEERNKEGFSVPCTIECDNEEEKARYYTDLDMHEKLVQDGLNLFGQKFKSLWW